MAKDPNKSSSENYREERKTRLAKAAEKKEKKSISPNMKKINSKVIGIIAAVISVILIITFFFSFFGLSKRMQTAVIASDGTKISVAEYEYFYRYFMTTQHNTSAQYEASYAQYYGAGAGIMMTGYDSTKTPENQKYTLGKLDEDKYGKEPTWADYFEKASLEACYVNRALAKEATKSGFKIDDKDKKSIDEFIEQVRKTAAENNFSLDAYLRENFGKGMNEKLLRSLFKNQTLAEKYLTQKQDEFKKDVSDDVILKDYEENKDTYDVCDLRMFSISSAATQASDEDKKSEDEIKAQTKADADKVKANAQKMFDGITNEETFISQAYAYAEESSKEAYKDNAKTLLSGVKKSDVTSNVSEDAANWVYEDGRVAGDKKLFTLENEDGSVTCFALYITNLPHRDDTPQPIDVRHILLAFDDNQEDGKDVTVTDELKATKLKEAEALLEKWTKGDAKEDSFSELAKKNSDDSGSAKDGGLVADITKSSNFVKPFIDWCFADGRKVGDTGIVESTYGYHIMYCSAISEKPEWKNTILSSIAEKKYNDFFDDYTNKQTKKIIIKDKAIAKVKTAMEKVSGKMIANA